MILPQKQTTEMKQTKPDLVNGGAVSPTLINPTYITVTCSRAPVNIGTMLLDLQNYK